MPESVSVVIHSSAFASARRQRLLDALRQHSLLPAFLYEGVRSASSWEALHSAHAPSMQARAEDSIHLKAFKWMYQNDPEPSHLASLGCGLAEKESSLVTLWGAGLEIVELVDVSVDLLCSAKRRLGDISTALDIGASVADLSVPEGWSDCFKPSPSAATIYSLFGMMPTLQPRCLLRQLAAKMRGGDWAVIDFNLLPETGMNTATVPAGIMRQYDNRECRDWLEVSLAEIGVFPVDGELTFRSRLLEDELLSVPQIQATFTATRPCAIRLFDESFSLPVGASLNAFKSNRFDRHSALKMLEQEGFNVAQTFYSDSGEDGVFVLQHA